MRGDSPTCALADATRTGRSGPGCRTSSPRRSSAGAYQGHRAPGSCTRHGAGHGRSRTLRRSLLEKTLTAPRAALDSTKRLRSAEFASCRGSRSVGGRVNRESVELRTPERVTTNRDANEQQLYYTTPGLCLDETHLIFLSDRTGHPEPVLRGISRAAANSSSATIVKATSSPMYYFSGRPYRGLGMASPSLHAGSGYGLLHSRGDHTCRRVEGKTEPIATLPEGQMTSLYPRLEDGRRLCVPTGDGSCTGWRPGGCGVTRPTE